MTKFAIIIPTFPPHFHFVTKFLQSYLRFASNTENVTLWVVTSSPEETSAFREQALFFPNLKVVDLPALLQEQPEGLNYNSQPSGKFAYQTIKKLYALRCIDYEYALILDSECRLIRPTDIEKLFTDYIKRPFQFQSSGRIVGGFNRDSLLTLFSENEIQPFVHNWIFEYQNWVFKKQLVLDMFNHINKFHNGSSVLDVCMKFQSSFSEIMYFWYAVHRNELELIDTREALKPFLGDMLDTYLNRYNGQIHGIIEHLFRFVDSHQKRGILDFISHYDLSFFRYETYHSPVAIEIIRESSNLKVVTCSDSVDCVPTFLSQ